MQVHRHADPFDAAVLEAWTSLVRLDPVGTPFHGPTWVGTWMQERGHGELGLRLVVDGDRPVAAFAEVVTRGSGGELVATVPGGRDLTDYRGPVGDPDLRLPAAEAWLSSLAADGVTTFDLHGISIDSGWLDAIGSSASTNGFDLVDRAHEDVCPRVDLQGDDPEAWLERLDGKERHELRRKGRKLARDLGGMQLVEAPQDGLDAAIARFWELAVHAEGDKGEFFGDPDHRRFFEAQARAFAGRGVLRIHELLAGGLPAAAMVSVVDGREWGLYNSAFDPALASFAPGTVLAAELCTLAAGEGKQTFDFLRGDEDYKYRFGAVDRVIEQATLRSTV